MKLTTKSEYSILALIYLARHEREGYVKLEAICAKYDISKKYLDQLFIVLRNNRLIKSKRGKEGGFKLARPSNRIMIADIIRLMDGALAPVESVSKYFYSHSPVEKEKKILAVFQDIRDYISHKLEHLKLSELV